MGAVLFYIFLCVVVGMLGKKTMLGFWGAFIFSLFFTPIIPLIYILIAVNIKKRRAPAVK